MLRNIRNIAATALLTLLAFTAVTYTACKKDNPCDKYACYNGGVCSDGRCSCPEGYEGAHCESKIDPCRDVVCENGGTCIYGECSCLLGYEGANCQTLSRVKFLGNWTGAETCTNGVNYQYTVTLNPSSNPLEFTMHNLYNNKVKVNCRLTSATSFTFKDSVNNTLFAGKGTLANGQLTIAYTWTDQVSNINCSYVGRQ
jgi:hypothetical protein